MEDVIHCEYRGKRSLLNLGVILGSHLYTEFTKFEWINHILGNSLDSVSSVNSVQLGKLGSTRYSVLSNTRSVYTVNNRVPSGFTGSEGTRLVACRHYRRRAEGSADTLETAPGLSRSFRVGGIINLVEGILRQTLCVERIASPLRQRCKIIGGGGV